MEFNAERFAELLREVSPRRITAEKGVHSDYLQTEVFDRLAREEPVDFARLDWSAFEMCHLLPEPYGDELLFIEKGWAEGMNHRLQNISPAQPKDQKFF